MANSSQLVFPRMTAPAALSRSTAVARPVAAPQTRRRMLARRPEMQVLFMSGYTEGEIGLLSDDGAEVQLLQKPFELHVLATRIREVFEARSRR